MPRTLFQKVWDEHVVSTSTGQPPLLYVDLHLVHEVTSPQAFDGLRVANRKVREPLRTIATVDHNIPTEPRGTPSFDPIAKRQSEALQANGRQFGIRTSEVEHVLATQCLPQRKPKTMLIHVSGRLGEGVSAKDLALGIIGKIGTDGATGHVIEYAGEAVRSLSVEGRMTLCNMSIEAGARAGMVAPDETTFAYVKGRRFAPHGTDWEAAVARWRTLPSDPGAKYDTVVEIDASELAPFVTWGTNPGMVVPITARVPDLPANGNANDRTNAQRMLEYMGLQPGTPMEQIKVDRVFIGSCTNSRLEDLRAAARVAKGHKVAPGVRAMVVPGSQQVKHAAEQEGLDRIFQEAGFEWRESGCSMCLGMNPDILRPGERCASTSNRN